MQPFKAIAAMSLNRVIGAGGKIPWHLPDDFKWFKQITTGHVIVMGRKTFLSLGRPLPNRTTIVLTHSPDPIPGVRTVSNLEQIDPADPALAGREIFICGGAQLYQHALPLCSDLYLTLVQRIVQGDTFFPPFEHDFDLVELIRDGPDFKILHYRRRTGVWPDSPPGPPLSGLSPRPHDQTTIRVSERLHLGHPIGGGLGNPNQAGVPVSRTPSANWRISAVGVPGQSRRGRSAGFQPA